MFFFEGLIELLVLAAVVMGRVLHPEHAHASSSFVDLGLRFAATVVCLTAWRKLGTGGKGARGWAIAASALLIFIGWANPHGTIWWIGGVCGLIVFSFKRESASAAIAVKPARMAGDGTSRVLDWIGTAVIYAGLIIGGAFWSAWALGHGLPQKGPFIESLPWILIAGLVATGFHESGHALAAIALDMKVRRVLVGPFSATFKQGRWEFRFLPGHILSAGGAVGAVPVTMEEYRWRQLLMVAAGPVASGGLAAFGFLITLNLPGTAWEPYWQVCSYVATFSLLGFVVNLIPMQPEGLYSDGAHIYRLLAGGAAAKIDEAFASVSTSLVAPVRPRDWNVELLAAAAGHCAGQRAVLLRLYAVSAHFDAGRSEQAEKALEQAESSYLAFAGATPKPLQQIVHESLTFYTAVIRRNAADARAWWNRTTWPRAGAWTSDALRSYAALLWLEGRTSEAEQVWAKGYAVAEKFPKAGTYDYDRDCFVRLRESMAAVAA